MALVDQKVDLIESATGTFMDAMNELDPQFASRIISTLTGVITQDADGLIEITPALLSSLEEIVLTSLQGTGYGSRADQFLEKFPDVDALNVRIHETVNRININSIINENARRNAVLNQFRIDLKGVANQAQRSSVLTDLITPISEMIRQDVLLGVTFKDAADKIRQRIVEGDLGLERWASQIARDGLRQYDGFIQNEIRKEFDMKYFRYIGSIVQNTRPVCNHILKDQEGSYTFVELDGILDEYCPEGVPSREKETYTTVDPNKTMTRQKGSGMIPGTSVENFTIRKGGYNCGHSVLPTTRPRK